MVDLVRAGRSPDDLAREFEPSSHSICAWVALADRQEGRREEAAPGLAAAERDELARLRREMRQLRLERDILSRAAAWFARETGTLPSGSSGSRAQTRPASRLPHGARARRVQGGPLRLAAPIAVCPRRGRRGVAEARPDRARHLAPDVWGTAYSRRSAGRRGEARTQADCALDARRRAGRCLSSAGWAHHDPARQGSPSRARPGGPQLHGVGAEPAMDRRYHLHTHGHRVPLPGPVSFADIPPGDRPKADGRRPCRGRRSNSRGGRRCRAADTSPSSCARGA